MSRGQPLQREPAIRRLDKKLRALDPVRAPFGLAFIVMLLWLVLGELLSGSALYFERIHDGKAATVGRPCLPLLHVCSIAQMRNNKSPRRFVQSGTVRFGQSLVANRMALDDGKSGIP
jgi:hypothetical protein